MAHNDPYGLLISLALDGELTEDEERLLAQHLASDPASAELHNRMMLVDATFTRPPLVPAPASLKANVMARINAAEDARRWHPWLVGVLVCSLVLAGLSVAAPVLFFSLGLHRVVAGWGVVTSAARVLSTLELWASSVQDMFHDWFTYLFSQPAALAVVLTALVLASIWIGLREAIRTAYGAKAAQQA